MSQNKHQVVDLYAPIISSRTGPPPLVFVVGTRPSQSYTIEGTVSGGQSTIKPEAYVLISALPQELQSRIATAIASLTQGM